MSRKKTVILLAAILLMAVFFQVYKIDEVPACLNADEAAHGYNAYSILKTGKDEYGNFLPLRFRSFEDYKMPLYIYLSVPFIKLFGLTNFSIRFLNLITGLLLIPAVYFLARELFGNKKIALIASFLISLSVWIYILSRHAHEGTLSAFFTLLSLFFLIQSNKKKRALHFLLTNFFILLAAFSYHTGRIFLLFVVLCQVFIFLKSKKRLFIVKKDLVKIIVILFTLVFPFLVDAYYGVNRLSNLLFIKNIGFQLRLNEYIGEHPLRIFHNKGTEAIREISNRYFSQLSPEFFLIYGDKNPRFGFQNLGLITPVEVIFFFVGLYYLFKNKQKYRYLILLLFLISPIGNALTWQDYSLIRTYFMIFPIMFSVSYGVYYFILTLKQKMLKMAVSTIVFALFFFFLLNNWDIYLNHYPKRGLTVRVWQCGYKELADYIKVNYDNYDNFFITDRHGQPYIFILYYLGVNPVDYQNQAKISAPDQYGFGQVERFDKFQFKFRFDEKLKKTVFIGYPDQFNDIELDLKKLKKIKIGTEEIFWIYEN